MPSSIALPSLLKPGVSYTCAGKQQAPVILLSVSVPSELGLQVFVHLACYSVIVHVLLTTETLPRPLESFF